MRNIYSFRSILIFLISFIACNSNNSTKVQPGSDCVNKTVTQLELARTTKNTSLAEGYRQALLARDLARSCKNDTLLIQSFIVTGKILNLQGKNNEALVIYENAIKESQTINYSKGYCELLIEQGIIYYSWGKYHIAFTYFSESLDEATKNNFKEFQAIANNYLGKYYHTTGQFDKSVNFYKKSYELHQKLGNYSQSATVLLSLGKTFLNENNIYMALQCYLDAYNVLEKSNDILEFSGVCNHLGSIYKTLGQTEKALEYHHKALILRKKLGTPEGMAKSYNNLGETFLMAGNLDSALFYLKKSLEYSQITNYKKGTVKALTNLGNLYLISKKNKEAYTFLTQAYSLAHEAGYSTGVAESSLAMGNYVLHEKRYPQAIEYFKESLEKANNSNLAELNASIYKGLYDCYVAQNQTSEALYYFKLFSEAEKKVLKAENNRQLTELRITFDSEKKEKDNEVLRKDNELKEMTIQRKSAFMWLIIAALAFTILLCIYILSRFINKRKANIKLEQLNEKIVRQNQVLEVLNQELEQANKEKDKILSIISHELRNPLFWFQNLAEVLSKRYSTMSQEKIQKTLSALDESAKNAYHLMDNLLNWSRSRLNRITPRCGYHSLERLVAESTRMFETILAHKKISLFANIPANSTIYADPDLLSCVVRNLVSNAIKYTPQNGTIDIDCTDNQSDFIISISDSGIGIPLKSLDILFDPNENFSHPGLLDEKGSGFGLKICKEFIELNKGKIWAKSQEGQGARFTFTVPKQYLAN